jgi:serine/threonine protein kinase
VPFDTIPDRDILVYRYLTEDLMSLARKQVPMRSRKQILKASLQGIAELHDCDIVHLGKLHTRHFALAESCSECMADLSITDVKPDNILVNYRHVDQEMVIEQV